MKNERTRQRMRLLQLASVTLAVAGFLGGCGDDENGNTGGASSGGAGAGGNAGGLGTTSGFLQTECGSCLSDTCASELSVCQAEPGCSEYVDCIVACPNATSGHVDPTCAQACALPNSTAALDAADQLIDCWFAGAGVECAACGQADVPVPEVLQQQCPASTNANPCFQCLDESCCETAANCLSVDGCGDLIDCINACAATDVPCNASCYENADPTALETYLKFSSCAGYLCGEECTGSPPGDCASCGQQECETTALACDLDPDCWLIGVCIAQCDQPGCTEMCTAGKPPDSVTTYETLKLCLRHLCSNECSGI